MKEWHDKKIKGEDGTVAICFGLSATLYFHEGHSREKRQAALECFNDYDRMMGELLHWHSVGANSRHMSPTAKLQNRDMSPYLLSPKWETEEASEHGWSFFWHGGQHRDDASPVKIHAYGSPRRYAELDRSLSFMQASFPLLWFQDRQNSFSDVLSRWVEILKPYHGYGGVTLLVSPDRGIAQAYSPEIGAFGGRYPGLEIDRPMSHKMVAQVGIKGGNWLTILSTNFVERLGGASELRARLGPPFVVRQHTGGLMIIAGDTPEIGDRNRNIDTPLYRQLAAVLKPIRITTHPPVYPKGRFAEEGQFEAWLARFD